MKTLQLAKTEISNLKKLPLDSKISNTEADLYILKIGKKIDDENLLFKKLYIIDKETMANKLFTISFLNDYKQKINIDEFVVPKHIVSTNGEVVGLTVEYLKDVENLGIILHDEKIDKKRKIYLLQKIGQLLEKTKLLKEKEINFFFHDLHEYNFLVDKNDKIYAIDLDSAALNDNYALPSMYAYKNNNISFFSKKYKFSVFGVPYPSDNVDYLSFISMFVNTLGNTDITEISKEDYFDYLFYLQNLGFGSNIINSLGRIYTNYENTNPTRYFDEIPMEKLNDASFEQFKIKKKVITK